jgi:3-methyl-2-oxobutanoate hydroxymethyltransferase
LSHDDLREAGYGRAGGDPPALEPTPVTVPTIRAAKGGQPLVMVTAYDATFARILDEAGADLLLVGDSLGMVVQGNDDTLSVTVDDIVYHCRAVTRGARRAHVVGDMPFLSYQVTPEDAIRNAGRVLQETNTAAVKLEGGVTMAPTIRALVERGIPVMGHIGLTPQSVHRMGGHKVQGRKRGKAPGARERLIDDAKAVERAGAFAVVLEGIPLELAAEITAELSIPTIGIGAGVHCDGQVLVLHDLLGLSDWAPKFAKRYANLGEQVVAAASEYVREVRASAFPADEHSFHNLVSIAAAAK